MKDMIECYVLTSTLTFESNILSMVPTMMEERPLVPCPFLLCNVKYLFCRSVALWKQACEHKMGNKSG